VRTCRGNGPAQYLRAVRYQNKTAAEFGRHRCRGSPLLAECPSLPCVSSTRSQSRAHARHGTQTPPGGYPWHALQTWVCYLAGLDYRSHCTGCNPASASSRSPTSSASPGLQVRRPTLPVNPPRQPQGMKSRWLSRGPCSPNEPRARPGARFRLFRLFRLLRSTQLCDRNEFHWRNCRDPASLY
jgi:hypothetical protein